MSQLLPPPTPGNASEPTHRPKADYPFKMVFAALIGIPLGVGLFTFRYAEGMAYMSNDPRICTNCHIMNDQYNSWAKSGHRHVAVCNDCHTPHDLVGKYTTKAINGWNHSKAFTLQNFVEPIRITPRNAAILQANCIRCHEPLVEDTLLRHDAHGEAVRCVHCHRSVGHGAAR